ncbi:MAG: hypothetical protein JW787_06320 [Sedimentisphaerales bacterium]|nr:hypothetical protein [Sedimentisphaerales bacterium]
MNNKNIIVIPVTRLLWAAITGAIIYTATFGQIQSNKTPDPNKEKAYFDIVQIKDINQLLNPLTGKKIVLSNEAESLRIAFYSERSLPKSKAIQLIYKYLREYGFIAAETNDAIYIKPDITKAKTNIPLITDGEKLSELNRDLVARKIFQLKYIRPSEICPTLGPMLSDRGYLSIEENYRIILVIDKVRVLSEIEKQISKLDSATSNLSPDPMVAFNVSDMIFNEIIQVIIQWTGKSIILPQEAMNLRITISAPRIIRRSQAIDLLYNAIKQQGFIIEETIDIIYIKSQPVHVKYYETLQTKYIDVNDAAAKLNEMISKSQPEIKDRISIQPLIEQKQLLIFGDEKVRQTAKLLLKHIDSESFIKAQQYDIIPINYDDANEVADSLHTILKEIKTDYTKKIYIAPLPELKQLLIFGDKEYCEIIQKLTKEYPPLNNHLQRKSFQLKYAEPLDVKNKIDEIFGDGSASNVQRSRTISSDKVITTTYPSLKQIIVLAPEETMKEIEKIIMEWDSPIVFQEMRQTEPNEQR